MTNDHPVCTALKAAREGHARPEQQRRLAHLADTLIREKVQADTDDTDLTHFAVINEASSPYLTDQQIEDTIYQGVC